MKFEDFTTREIQPRISSRFHIIHEGVVTENELLAEMIQDFSFTQKQNLVKGDIQITIHNENIANPVALKKIIAEGKYTRTASYIDFKENNESEETITLYQDDILFWMIDLDVFDSHHYIRAGQSPDQAKERSDNVKASFVKTYKECHDLCDSKGFKLYFVPNNASIEFPIAIGCELYSETKYQLSCDKETYFKVFDEVLQRRISRRTKSFVEIIQNSKLFKIEKMYSNANQLRIKDRIPGSLESINEQVSNENDLENLLNKNIPFTFIDFLHLGYASVLDREY